MSEWRDKETLESLYHEEQLNQQEIAEQLGCSSGTVSRWMDKHNIGTRGTNESRYLEQRNRLKENRESIVESYKAGKPLYKVADDYDVNDATIKRFLQSHDVDTRDISEQNEISMEGKYDELVDEETLRELYHTKGMSVHEIAEKVGCNAGLVQRWMNKHNIERRDRVEASANAQRGEPSIYTKPRSGYEFIYYRTYAVRMHRLLATLLVDDIDELKGKHVHHESEVEWDNRLSNLSILDVGEHLSIHNPMHE